MYYLPKVLEDFVSDLATAANIPTSAAINTLLELWIKAIKQNPQLRSQLVQLVKHYGRLWQLAEIDPSLSIEVRIRHLLEGGDQQ